MAADIGSVSVATGAASRVSLLGRVASCVVLVCAVFASACGDDDATLDAGLDASVGDASLDANANLDSSVEDASVEDASVDASADASAASDAGALDRYDEVLATLRGESDPAALDALLVDVGRREGWPLVSGDRWLFATRWAATGVAWVGDPNAWDPSANVAETAPSGVHHFAEVRIATAPRGAKYKWWSASVFRAPPESTVYGEDEFGEHGYVAPPTDRAFFERFPGFVAEGVQARWIRARVPADFAWAAGRGSFAERAVRTLLLHDGQNVFLSGGPFGSWRVDETLEASFDDVLAVAVDNGPDRFETYTPVPDDIGSGAVGGGADAYLALLEGEVLPFVRARYDVRASGDSLAIAGSSLGGLVSLYAAYARPELARCAAGLSSTLGWGAFARDGSGTLVRRWSTDGATSVYLDSGGGLDSGACADADADGVFEDSDDRDNYCVTVQLRDRLVSLGYELGADLHYHHAPGAPHAEAAWAARVSRFLDACVTGGWRAD